MESDLVARALRTTGFVARLALLLSLLVGLVVSTAVSFPSARTLERFRSAVLAGEVERIDYWTENEGALTSLVWSESPLAWHRVEGPIVDLEGPYTTALLMADLRNAPDPPVLVMQRPWMESSGNGFFPDWPFASPGGWWIGAAWILAFLAMLCSTPRLANRWAWFWLFTVGQIGVFLFLVLEPRPLWRRHGEELAPSKRVNGRSGCGYSILLAIVSMAVAVAIGRLVELAVG
ncbi:hypothetical protein [Nonomuraea aridisoli]|uniref:Uncharacterized protein n=1 Tax=Nonomuraea aridisoli TaxID=2070368 RepID=A0A2W2DUE3_9ACTN|nr:hypothetical protein [Nonomuraea aridisoli]PZG03368.1 hypothetical protein C1J01_46060 [Nonomuraea aridisoli]